MMANGTAEDSQGDRSYSSGTLSAKTLALLFRNLEYLNFGFFFLFAYISAAFYL